jgi:hypothetical protein
MIVFRDIACKILEEAGIRDQERGRKPCPEFARIFGYRKFFFFICK